MCLNFVQLVHMHTAAKHEGKAVEWLSLLRCPLNYFWQFDLFYEVINKIYSTNGILSFKRTGLQSDEVLHFSRRKILSEKQQNSEFLHRNVHKK